jgi:hypothetical protein
MLALYQATGWTSQVKASTINEAKTILGKIARDVLRSKKPVAVLAGDSLIQIAP